MSRQFLSVNISNVATVRRSMPDLRSPVEGKVVYRCKGCNARITTKTSVVSWEFRGASGKAALAKEAENVSLADPTVLLMNSGVYRVQNSTCAECETPIGWKFVKATEKGEKWKEGHFCLELAHLREDSTTPLSPLDPPPIEAQWSRLSMHKRSHSTTPEKRPRPMGPRARIRITAC
ncbi:yippee-domain-containing protein [Trametopsis cervina]|nr:yippee-domain-containing protein [Trametopsis cervina]